MNESTVRISGSLLIVRVKKSFIFVKDNRERIYKERLNHYLFMVNTNNKKRSKKWWAFLLPKRFKSPFTEAQVNEKVKNKMRCHWGNIDRLNQIKALCITGHDIIVCASDMEALICAENANNWKSGATPRTDKEIKDIWA
jgi:hypothetical protein